MITNLDLDLQENRIYYFKVFLGNEIIKLSYLIIIIYTLIVLILGLKII
jgi:hypothetical protein